MDDKKQILAELNRTIIEAQSNNWIPLTIIISFLIIILGLLFALLKKERNEIKKGQTDNKESICEQKEWLKKLTDISTEQKVIIKELQVMTMYHDKDINQLKNA